MPIDATTTEQPLIGCVDDGVYLQLRDVPSRDSDCANGDLPFY